MVRQFVDEQVLPIAEEHDHEDKFPEAVVEQMKELGLFGVTIPEEYGGMGLDLTTYAMIVEELSRGWISISGIVNTHFIGSYLLMKFGTDEQKEKLPAADGHRRDPRRVLALRARPRLRRPGDLHARQEGRRRLGHQRPEDVGHERPASGLVFLLAKSDPDADPPYKGMTCFITEKEPGAAENTGDYAGPRPSRRKIKKMGYKGVESTELVYEDYRCPAENVLGGEEAGLNKGFGADDGRARGRPRERRRARRRASPSARSSSRCATRRSARRSAARSPSTRRSSSSSPTWPPRSRPRAC